MKKTKHKVVGSIIAIIVILSIIIWLFFLFQDKNKLNILEKNWLDNNRNNIQNIRVINNIPILGNVGSGVYFDFINDFAVANNVRINTIPITSADTSKAISLTVTTKVSPNQKLMWEDHFVVVGLDTKIITSISELNKEKMGVLAPNASFLTDYLSSISNLTWTQYATKEELLTALDNKEIGGAIVPRVEFIETILSKKYSINYHLNGANLYYVVQTDNSTLGSILAKYFNNWFNKNFENSFNKNTFETFASSMNITSKDNEELRSKIFSYAFVDESPYQTIKTSKFGGIISVYLKQFSAFSGIEFKYVKYKKDKDLIKGIAKKEIDLYFSLNDLKTSLTNISSEIIPEAVIVANVDNPIVLKNIKSILSKEVYALKGSIIAEYFKANTGIKLKEVDDLKSLFKIKDIDALFLLDKNVFEYYHLQNLKNYSIRYQALIPKMYNFKSLASDKFNSVLSAYISFVGSETMVNMGISNHLKVVQNNNISMFILRVAIYVVIIITAVIIIFLKTSKKIVLVTKIKKEDKMRFIDQLTGLKNRNYLTENIEKWNDNKIFPQATVIIDLNSIQKINDNYGYEEGDSQIQSMANILIKTQIDNSDIIRTSGNEFLVYLVGYSEKQVISYIKKISRELKSLPYEDGASIGFSMIVDKLKDVSDAINEAVIDMRSKKSESNEE